MAPSSIALRFRLSILSRIAAGHKRTVVRNKSPNGWSIETVERCHVPRLTAPRWQHTIRPMDVQSPAIGTLLGHYRILEQIGHGGMGVVFRARDERLEREVAVKILPPGTFPNENARKRFRREA